MLPLARSPAKKVDPIPVAIPSAEVAPGSVTTSGNDVAAALPAKAPPTRRAAIENAPISRRMGNSADIVRLSLGSVGRRLAPSRTLESRRHLPHPHDYVLRYVNVDYEGSALIAGFVAQA